MVASTTLAFGLRSETRSQLFYLDFDNVLRITDLPGEGTEALRDLLALDTVHEGVGRLVAGGVYP